MESIARNQFSVKGSAPYIGMALYFPDGLEEILVAGSINGTEIPPRPLASAKKFLRTATAKTDNSSGQEVHDSLDNYRVFLVAWGALGPEFKLDVVYEKLRQFADFMDTILNPRKLSTDQLALVQEMKVFFSNLYQRAVRDEIRLRLIDAADDDE